MTGLATATSAPSAPRAEAVTGLARYLGVALSWALFLLVLAVAVILIVVPKAAGGTPLTVLTSSMEPALPPGTLIVVRPVGADELRIGDVATYQIRSGEPAVITHRIIAIASTSTGGRTFTFQGDNNSAPDSEQVMGAQIQGRLWYSVPFVGYVNNGVNGANRAWIIPAAALLLLSYAGYMIAAGTVAAARGKRKGREPASIAPESEPTAADAKPAHV